ncbi:hypothetical protein GGR77_004017 [Xanthomonas translucens]
MAYILLLIIAAFNCAALFVLSLLAAGDGSTELTFQVWRFGYPWIAVFAIVALIQCSRGRRAAAIAIASATLPAGYAALLVGMVIVFSFNWLKPNAPELEVACKTAGPRYLQKPVAVVESIAYDWEPGTDQPQFNYIAMNKRGNVGTMGYTSPHFPKSIKFIEERCCKPSARTFPYKRYTEPGKGTGIPELTADVVVTYKVTYAPMAGSESKLETVDMAVTDRRDGRALATLRYILDEHDRRGCGAVTEGAMDEHAFIRRAIGLD